MDWNASTLWWLATGALVAAELVTGTFYLLMLALGTAFGALAAHAGVGSTAQTVCAAGFGAAATALWHYNRARAPRSAPAASNRDVNLDIGGTLRVEAWDATGLARARYRGADWSVRFAGAGAPAPGEHVIVAIEGSQLLVSNVNP